MASPPPQWPCGYVASPSETMYHAPDSYSYDSPAPSQSYASVAPSQPYPSPTTPSAILQMYTQCAPAQSYTSIAPSHLYTPTAQYQPNTHSASYAQPGTSQPYAISAVAQRNTSCAPSEQFWQSMSATSYGNSYGSSTPAQQYDAALFTSPNLQSTSQTSYSNFYNSSAPTPPYTPIAPSKLLGIGTPLQRYTSPYAPQQSKSPAPYSNSYGSYATSQPVTRSAQPQSYTSTAPAQQFNKASYANPFRAPNPNAHSPAPIASVPMLTFTPSSQNGDIAGYLTTSVQSLSPAMGHQTTPYHATNNNQASPNNLGPGVQAQAASAFRQLKYEQNQERLMQQFPAFTQEATFDPDYTAKLQEQRRQEQQRRQQKQHGQAQTPTAHGNQYNEHSQYNNQNTQSNQHLQSPRAINNPSPVLNTTTTAKTTHGNSPRLTTANQDIQNNQQALNSPTGDNNNSPGTTAAATVASATTASTNTTTVTVDLNPSALTTTPPLLEPHPLFNQSYTTLKLIHHPLPDEIISQLSMTTASSLLRLFLDFEYRDLSAEFMHVTPLSPPTRIFVAEHLYALNNARRVSGERLVAHWQKLIHDKVARGWPADDGGEVEVAGGRPCEVELLDWHARQALGTAACAQSAGSEVVMPLIRPGWEFLQLRQVRGPSAKEWEDFVVDDVGNLRRQREYEARRAEAVKNDDEVMYMGSRPREPSAEEKGKEVNDALQREIGKRLKWLYDAPPAKWDISAEAARMRAASPPPPKKKKTGPQKKKAAPKKKPAAAGTGNKKSGAAAADAAKKKNSEAGATSEQFPTPAESPAQDPPLPDYPPIFATQTAPQIEEYPPIFATQPAPQVEDYPPIFATEAEPQDANTDNSTAQGGISEESLDVLFEGGDEGYDDGLKSLFEGGGEAGNDDLNSLLEDGGEAGNDDLDSLFEGELNE